MGVRVIQDERQEIAALYDSVSMTAFGPLFGPDDERGIPAEGVAQAFLDWLRRDDVPSPEFCPGLKDARLYSSEELQGLVSRFYDERQKAPKPPLRVALIHYRTRGEERSPIRVEKGEPEVQRVMASLVQAGAEIGPITYEPH